MNGGGRRGKGQRRSTGYRPMSEINVTPMVDVMLVLLIIFMVSAPLLTVGVPIDLPQTQGTTLDQTDKEPLAVSVDNDGKVFLQNTEIELETLVPKLEAIAQALLTITPADALGWFTHCGYLPPTQTAEESQ